MTLTIIFLLGYIAMVILFFLSSKANKKILDENGKIIKLNKKCIKLDTDLLEHNKSLIEKNKALVKSNEELINMVMDKPWYVKKS